MSPSTEYQWDSWNLDHIARHGISAGEAEEVLENDPYDLDVQIVNGEVRTPHLGETSSGRILIVIAQWMDEERKARVVTAFEPTKRLRKDYIAWKGTRHDTDPRNPKVPKSR
jgi:uncharacterized DUF497 family protein